eukprot:g8668.t1
MEVQVLFAIDWVDCCSLHDWIDEYGMDYMCDYTVPEAVTIREFKWQLKDLLPARRVSTVELILGLNKLTDESKTVEEAGISDGSEVQVLFRAIDPVECSHGQDVCRVKPGRISSLLAVKIPISVTEIQRHAFWNCRALMKVDIPDSDTSICDFKQKLKDMQQYEDEMTRQLTIVDVVCDVQKLDDDQKTLVESGIEDGAEVQVLFRSMEPVECSHRFSYGQRPVQGLDTSQLSDQHWRVCLLQL